MLCAFIAILRLGGHVRAERIKVQRAPRAVCCGVGWPGTRHPASAAWCRCRSEASRQESSGCRRRPGGRRQQGRCRDCPPACPSRRRPVTRRWLVYNQISGAGTQISVEETRYDQKSGQQRAQISVQGGDRRISGGLGPRYLRACQPDTCTTRPTQISGPYLTTDIPTQTTRYLPHAPTSRYPPQHFQISSISRSR